MELFVNLLIATHITLGVRPGIDVPALYPLDIVQPGQGGLSVSPDDPLNLPYFRRPPEWQGAGNLRRCFDRTAA